MRELLGQYFREKELIMTVADVEGLQSVKALLLDGVTLTRKFCWSWRCQAVREVLSNRDALVIELADAEDFGP